MEFNSRVLALVEDPDLPLLERGKFLAISSQNLNELFQIRLAALEEQLLSGLELTSPDGLTPRRQLAAVRRRTEQLVSRADRVYQQLRADLSAEGIRIADFRELEAEARKHLQAVFEAHLFPLLTPLAVDPAHPFPYISSLSLNLAVVVTSREEEGASSPASRSRPSSPGWSPFPTGSGSSPSSR